LLRRFDQIRKDRYDSAESSGLIVRPATFDPISRHRRIYRSGDRRPTEQYLRQKTWSHECVSDCRNIVVSLFVFHKHRLAQEIAERDAKRLGYCGKDVEPPNLAITALDFTQKVFRPAD
jgi:hypothetical protein